MNLFPELLQRAFHKLARILRFARSHWLAHWHGRQLELVQDRLREIRPGDIILFSVMKNETPRLRYFVEYYRSVGVNHFIFVDNDSTDGFDEFAAACSDISCFHTAASYKNSKFGVHWLNYLLLHYGSGHWCLTCDPDEFLVYPRMDSRNLRELTEYLDANYLESFYTLMIDMYGDAPVEDAAYLPGQDPLEVCPYFDRHGYSKSFWAYFSAMSAIGGVRRRMFFNTCPEIAPAINKTPLIRWRRHFIYELSTHIARPNRLNEGCDPELTTGALLHFKFFSNIHEKVAVEMLAEQHWDNSVEYRKYNEVLEQKTCLFDEDISFRYKDWRTLVALGLVNTGEW